MPAQKLKEFLDRNNVKFVTITHSTSYTAQEAAQLAHIKGRELAKTVIVTVDGAMAMAVLPASDQVDFALLREGAEAKHVTLATEEEFRDKFPECETGAMPPFGNLYGMRVFSELRLSRDREIAFNAGTHHELVRLSYDDYARLVQPEVLRFSAARARASVA